MVKLLWLAFKVIFTGGANVTSVELLEVSVERVVKGMISLHRENLVRTLSCTLGGFVDIVGGLGNHRLSYSLSWHAEDRLTN